MNWRLINRVVLTAFPITMLCGVVLLGGSSQPGQLTTLAIQFGCGLVILATLPYLTAITWTRAMLAFPVLLLLLAAYALIQLIPLPVDVWSSLPERTAIVEGWALLGLSADRVFPISLSPSETRTALLGIVPPIAMFLVLCAVGWRRAIWPFFWLIPVLGAVSALLGIAQVVSGNGAQLSWHDVANHGSAIGVFANANHQASFCLMCLPFTAALAGRHRQDWNAGDDDVAIAIAIFGLFALNLVGVLAGGSVAGYLLLIPVGVFSAFLLFGIRTKEGQRPILLYATMAGSIAAAVVLVVSSPVLDGLGITSFGDGDLTRRGIWSTSTEIATDQLATGAGLGTFTEAYRLYENDSNITTRFVNNAHNDYLQIAAELGVFGIALLGLGLSAFAILFFQSWTTRIDRDYRFRRAASVALLVPILHSLVDYPVRTPAIACLVAVCFAIMVLPRNRIVEPKPTETRPGHVSI